MSDDASSLGMSLKRVYTASHCSRTSVRATSADSQTGSEDGPFRTQSVPALANHDCFNSEIARGSGKGRGHALRALPDFLGRRGGDEQATRLNADDTLKLKGVLGLLSLPHESAHYRPRAQRSMELKRWSRLAIREDNILGNTWLFIIDLLLVYTATYFPFRFSFIENRVGHHASDVDDFADGWFIAENVFDGFFWVDLIMHFFYTYRDQFGHEVVDIPNIARTYLSSFFLVDFLTCLPPGAFGVIVWLLTGRLQDTRSGKLGRLLRVGRVLKMARLIRISRLQFISRFNSSIWAYRLMHFRGFRLIRLYIVLIWVVHLVACGLFFIAAVEADTEDTWLGRCNIIHDTVVVQWIHSMYFVLTTFTTTGYGDNYAVTVGEICYVCCMMILGAIVNGVILSEILRVFTERDRATDQRNHIRKLVEDFAHHTNLKTKVRQELMSWTSGLAMAKHSVGTKDSREINKLINSYLPVELLRSLPDHVFGGQLIHNTFLTKPMDMGLPVATRLSLRIAVCLSQWQYRCMEYVYYKLDHPGNVFLVLDGTFAYVAENNVRAPEGKLITNGCDAFMNKVKSSRTFERCATTRKWGLGPEAKSSTSGAMLRKRSKSKDMGLQPYQLFSFNTYFGDLELLGIETKPRWTTARCESLSGGVVLKLSKEDIGKLVCEFKIFGVVWSQLARLREGQRRKLRDRLDVPGEYRYVAARNIQVAYHKYRKRKDNIGSPSQASTLLGVRPPSAAPPAPTLAALPGMPAPPPALGGWQEPPTPDELEDLIVERHARGCSLHEVV